MATLRDAQLLSLDVYHSNTQAGAGWTRIGQDSGDESGFFGAAYRKGNEIVVAFRGWNGLDPRDAINIERAYDGKPFQQIDDAQNFLDDVIAANPGAQISLTGHSLGGAIAAILAVRNNLEARTFAGIESAGAAFESMNGYDFDVLGQTVWSIPIADFNRNITRAQLSGYAGVNNHLIFGDVATYIDKTVPLVNHIGIDHVYAGDIRFGQLSGDSRFGRYSNVYGDLFTEIVGADPVGTPYNAAFETQLHALGFLALELTFRATLDPLWTQLPRLALQLTNDRLGSDAADRGKYQVTYDFLDQVMLDHFNAAGGATVASAMAADFHDIATAGAKGVARANADINTAFLQLAIEYASVQTLGDAPEHAAGGIVTNGGDELAANLGSQWGTDFAPEGARLIRAYADHLLGGWIAGAAAHAATLFADANDNDGADITGRAGHDLIFGGSAADALAGAARGDVAFGFGGGDFILGGAGADILSGGRGRDWLYGGSGADTLTGGVGADRLIGWTGGDIFVFDRLKNGPNGDAVADFAPAEDSMFFDTAAFDALGPKGVLTSERYFAGPAAYDGNDRLIFDASNGALFYDADGTGAAAQIRVATLTSGLALTFSDFTVI